MNLVRDEFGVGLIFWSDSYIERLPSSTKLGLSGPMCFITMKCMLISYVFPPVFVSARERAWESIKWLTSSSPQYPICEAMVLIGLKSKAPLDPVSSAMLGG